MGTNRVATGYTQQLRPSSNYPQGAWTGLTLSLTAQNQGEHHAGQTEEPLLQGRVKLCQEEPLGPHGLWVGWG